MIIFVGTKKGGIGIASEAGGGRSVLQVCNQIDDDKHNIVALPRKGN